MSVIPEESQSLFEDQESSIEKGFLASIKKSKENKNEKISYYTKNCRQYWLPPVSAVKKCLEDQSSLNLKYYIPKNLGTYLAFHTFCLLPLSKITDIDMGYSPFEEIGCAALSEFLEQSSSVKNVNLGGCKIGVEGVKILAEGFEISQSITHLDLSFCDLTDEGGVIVARKMTFNEICKVLNLSHNNLYVLSGEELGNMLKQNKTLQHLYLSHNELYPTRSTKKLMAGLQSNISLETLDLSWNGLTGNSFVIFLNKMLRKNKVLKILKLEYNQMVLENFEKLCKALTKAKALQELYIGGNWCTQQDLTNILNIFLQKIILKKVSVSPGLVTVIAGSKTLQLPEEDKVLPFPPDFVDNRFIACRRVKFLAMAPKQVNQRKNMGHFMLQLEKFAVDHLTQEAFIEETENFKAKIDYNLIEFLAEAFLEDVLIKEKLKKRVGIKSMAKFYLNLYPTEPPLPPVKKTVEPLNKTKSKKK